MAPKRVPEGWEKYSNMGLRVSGTRFISFKVPLDPEYNMGFTPLDLIKQCKQLGMVIDLTNTNRYYNSECFTNQNIKYLKINTEGHKVPSNYVVKKFFDATNNFLEETPDDDKLVGVHCTHGTNRTGYLICRYMIQVLDISPDQAVAAFDSARGHAQERYLDDLLQASWKNEDPATY